MTAADTALVKRAAETWAEQQHFAASYDRLSDTLVVHFFDRSLPAVSHPVGDVERDLFYVRVEPITNRPVGLQIEGFIARFLDEFPRFVTVLDVAELLDISSDEVQEFKRRIERRHASAVVADFLACVAADEHSAP